MRELSRKAQAFNRFALKHQTYGCIHLNDAFNDELEVMERMNANKWLKDHGADGMDTNEEMI